MVWKGLQNLLNLDNCTSLMPKSGPLALPPCLYLPNAHCALLCSPQFIRCKQWNKKKSLCIFNSGPAALCVKYENSLLLAHVILRGIRFGCCVCFCADYKSKSHTPPRGKNTVIINLTTIVIEGNDTVTLRTRWPLCWMAINYDYNR